MSDLISREFVFSAEVKYLHKKHYRSMLREGVNEHGKIRGINQKIEADLKMQRKEGIAPFIFNHVAKILISSAHISARESACFEHQSGDNLRSWLVTRFLLSIRFPFVVLMDYHYPGKGKSDLPPRKGFYEEMAWRNASLNASDTELIVLVGKYAQDYYLKETKKKLNGNVKA